MGRLFYFLNAHLWIVWLIGCSADKSSRFFHVKLCNNIKLQLFINKCINSYHISIEYRCHGLAALSESLDSRALDSFSCTEY